MEGKSFFSFLNGPAPQKKPISTKMPIGVDDFKELIEADYFFADKTNFIIDILSQRAKVLLITRPRRFGKTLNLSMLRYFFDIRNAKENRKLFDNLDVSHNRNAMAEMGQYPVIMLSLKGVKSPTLEDQLDYFRTIIQNLYDDHAYLLDNLDTIDTDFFHRVREEKTNEAQLASSLRRLIKWVARYHNKKVVVLLDEYDQPLLNAFRGGFEETFGLFYRNFMGTALKGNGALHFAVVTGVMQMAGSGMFSDFNNADTYNLLDERYSTAFGFTEEEVQSLFTMMEQKNKLREVKHWYNGYLFGTEGHVMYNPWSVLQYVSKNCVAKAYWANTSDNQLLKKELHAAGEITRAKFVALMTEEGKVTTALRDSLYFSEVGSNKEHSLWVLLLSAGYLKAHIKPNPPSGLISVDLSIPNEEVRFIYRHLFQSWLADRLGSEGQATSLLMKLVSGDIEAFCQALEVFFLQSISVHDVRSDNIETFYHGFILGLLALMHQSHMGHFRSNLESGFGRFDIAFEPRDPKEHHGIIFELKRLDPLNIKDKSERQIKKQLETSAKEGLEQIATKAYDADLQSRGIKHIDHISLAFSGKQMAYRCKKAD